MFINEFIKKRSCCPVCGGKISMIRRMNISIVNDIACPYCNTRLTFDKFTFVLNVLLYILIFPSLSLIFTKHHFIFGSLALLLILFVSLFPIGRLIIVSKN
jgi:uncharacterized protein YbaR (Trm112 family)